MVISDNMPKRSSLFFTKYTLKKRRLLKIKSAQKMFTDTTITENTTITIYSPIALY